MRAVLLRADIMLKIIHRRCVPESETLRLVSVDISFSRAEAEIADVFIFRRHKEPVADFRQYRAFLDNVAVKAERHAAVEREFVIDIGVITGGQDGPPIAIFVLMHTPPSVSQTRQEYVFCAAYLKFLSLHISDEPLL